MNWYVLYTLHYKTKSVISHLNRYNDIIAFVPEHELCQRKTKEIIVKPMFHNYVFVKTHKDQNEFNQFLFSLKEEKNGIVKQLRKEELTALTLKEIEFFETVLDEQFVVRLSHGYQKDGMTHIIDGPLKSLEKHIVKVNKNKQCAYLDLCFFDRSICIGIEI
ncbi:MAG: hypothetical protein EOM11_10430 [Erysipelotrichia bacterium]|nr:hypothetical protein [Erysipelotrichia bacterium]